MVIDGANRTVTHQAFKVDVGDLENGGKALVFHHPGTGEAHVYALTDDSQMRVWKGLSPIKVADLGDVPPPSANGGGS